MELRVVASNEADLDEIVHFQRRCFEGQPGARELALAQTPEYYLWKYTLIQPARIAELRRDGQLVAMCAAFPLPLRRNGDSIMGWQICDIATAPSERRKGFFKSCAAALAEALPAADVFFGFPNENSAPQLTAMGWRSVETLSPFFGVIPHLTTSPTVQRIDRFGDAQELSPLHGTALQIFKSSAYMTARYCSPLRPIYSCYVVRDGSQELGWIVLRVLHLSGVKLSVIMDIFAINVAARKMLIRHAGYWSRQKGCVATVSFNNEWRAMEALRHGLLAIPRQLMPRQLVLMVSGRRGGGLERWRSQVGDWDGF